MAISANGKRIQLTDVQKRDIRERLERRPNNSEAANRGLVPRFEKHPTPKLGSLPGGGKR